MKTKFIALSACLMTLTSVEARHEIARRPTYPADDIFLNRWSPRAMSGEVVTDKELMTLFEAARWAPSSCNSQPWRFLYAKRDTQYWNKFFDLLVPFNQEWCATAGVLVVIISRTNFSHNSKPSRTHAYDTGAAWQNMALQGSLSGLVVHGMSGFDYDKARKVLSVPDGYRIEAMCAIGKPGKVKDLSSSLQKSEHPSDRVPLGELVAEGGFSKILDH